VAYNAIFSMAGPAPWAFHLLNLVLHACVTAVVFVLTLELWKDLRIAGIAGLLFALHPIHTEPVAWIAALPELGFSLFFLLAFYFHVIDYTPRRDAILASVAGYGVALLWKETALMFLPCVVLYDLLVARRRNAGRYAWLGGVTLAYLMLRIAVLGSVARAAGPPIPPAAQVLTALANLSIYLQRLVLPVNLTIYYAQEIASAIDVRIAAVILLFAVGVWKLRGKIAWSAAWIPLTLLPSLLVALVAVPLSERNLYLPSVGFCWLAASVLSRLRPALANAICGAIAALYLAGCWVRLPDWRDDLPLFNRALQLDPDNTAIPLRLSGELGRRRQYKEAVDQLDTVLDKTPAHPAALTAKAGLMVLMEDWKGAETACTRVFLIDPRSAKCHFALGLVRQHEERLKEAWESFDRAHQSNPRFWQALYQQGTIALKVGDFPAAAQRFESVVEQSPSAQAFDNLGTTYDRMGESAKSIGAFQTALRIDPSFLPAQQNLKLALQKAR
jgi:tetratricopeptide (TPR) repeat protein